MVNGRSTITFEAGDVIARIEEQPPEAGKTVEIQAPISGTLVAMRCWPGQTVIPGELIATIAADHGQHIVGYIPEESSLAAKPGMRVTLRTRTAGGQRMTSEVEEVGQQIEQIPRHQRTSSTMPQWGTAGADQNAERGGAAAGGAGGRAV